MSALQTLPLGGGSPSSALAAGWRFTRHLGEMILAMLAGMAVLGGAVRLLGRPPGYDDALAQYAWMAVAMSVPMVAWMRYRGHRWPDCWAMTAAMVVPMGALVGLVALGWLPLTPMDLMMGTHVAMIGGMVILMLARWRTYAHAAHCHHSANADAAA
jgi:flagellar biosynthetic protein FliP